MPTIGGINLGNLTDFLFVFTDGSTDANWQGATKGFVGDVAVDGEQADERTSGSVPYAGTIFTNDVTLGAWQAIVNQNPGQASASLNQDALIAALEADLVSAFQQINALAPTPGYESVSSTSLNGLNTQNGMDEVFVINITSGLNFSSQINITGDAGDVFILRWDTDGDPTNGYQGQVKPQSGGAIVPHGGLKPTNFINVAGNINSSGGGSTPAPPYPQGPRFNDGQGALINGGSDFSGGGFFTGYWLTTGKPDNFDPGSGLFYGETDPLSNGIFVGGWYTITTKFSMTSGTSGVYVSPNPATVNQPSIDVEKEVSPDNGATWFDADTPPGPQVLVGTNPRFRFTVTNNGNETLSNVAVTDDVFGTIASGLTLNPGQSQQFIVIGTWALGQQQNTATATGDTPGGQTVTDTDPAFWVGVEAEIDVEKEVSPDNGVTWFDADTPTGPAVPVGTDPQFRFTVTNTGTQTLTDVSINDDVYGLIASGLTLNPGESQQFVIVRPWASGQQVNTATATGTTPGGDTVSDTDPAYWFGAENPAIDLEKLVSPDNGVTFFDADVPPGPFVSQGTDPVFQFVVTNTGGAPLTNLTLVDSDFGNIPPPVATLFPGDSYTVFMTGTWQSGQQTNTAIATGEFNGQTVEDTDVANYFGTTAAIDVEKEVSPDNGLTWFDADVPPGPDVPSGTDPQFRFTVTNTGTETLTNVQVTDDVMGLVETIPSLDPGETSVTILVGTWAAGQQVNTATATGTTPQGGTVSDTDPAYWFGVQGPIDVEKEVSPDNGLTWYDADTPPGPQVFLDTDPQFRFTVTNTGSETLTDVSITDDVLGFIAGGLTLDPGESQQFVVGGTWAQGQQVNTATATGTTPGGQTVTDTDPAYWRGQVFPDISNPAPQHEIIDRLLETIALEELALSHLINAEAEKVQAVAAAGVMGPVSAETLKKINEAVAEVVREAGNKEDRLRRKLERILNHKETNQTP